MSWWTFLSITTSRFFFSILSCHYFFCFFFFFFFQAEDGIRDLYVPGVQTCALPIWRLKPVIQGGNRAIVEVGPREPDAVERLGEVAVELLELVEGPREAPAVAVLVLPVLVVVVVGGGRLLGPHAPAVVVGADLGERDDGQHALSVWRMTAGAVGLEQGLALREQRLVDLEGRLWGFEVAKVAPQPVDGLFPVAALAGAVAQRRVD